MNCENCNNEHNGIYGSGRFCTSKCARSFSSKEKRQEINKKVSEKLKGRKLPEEQRLKISINNGKYWKGKKPPNYGTKKPYTDETKAWVLKGELNCEKCNMVFVAKFKRTKYCKECLPIIRSINGKKGSEKSVKLQYRRSKNEIYFSQLCENIFKNVELNSAIFNGWDADIIIHDIKIAVLWNGAWHYKKIKKGHSIEQVQNRDKIKIKEINNFGYTPYIIRDDGRYKKKFVENEFEKFKIYCGIEQVVSSLGS